MIPDFKSLTEMELAIILYSREQSTDFCKIIP